MTMLNDVMPGRIWVENHGASAMWDGDGEVLVSGPPSKSNCDVAEYIRADAHAAAIADRDRLAAEVARLTEALEAERGVSDALTEAASLALRSHGRTLLSDPPQDPWKFHRVSARLEQAIAAHAARREGEA